MRSLCSVAEGFSLFQAATWREYRLGKPGSQCVDRCSVCSVSSVSMWGVGIEGELDNKLAQDLFFCGKCEIRINTKNKQTNKIWIGLYIYKKQTNKQILKWIVYALGWGVDSSSSFYSAPTFSGSDLTSVFSKRRNHLGLMELACRSNRFRFAGRTVWETKQIAFSGILQLYGCYWAVQKAKASY